MLIAAALVGIAAGPASARTWNEREGCSDVTYGLSTDTPIVGDWNGDGSFDELGVVRSGHWYLGTDYCFPSTQTSFGYGLASDKPLPGDWNGDGTDTAGVVRGNQWLLRNSNTPGSSNLSFSFGRSTDVFLAGDWDGDGVDTPAVWRSGVFYLRDGAGVVRSFGYGRSTDIPIVGDWDGNGIDTIGVKRGQAFYLSDNNSTAALVIGYGLSGLAPSVGKFGTFSSDFSHARDSVGTVQ